jgi:ethanolamine utilization protein
MEKLVQMITQEVMRRIQISVNNTEMDKEKVLVISSSQEELTKVKELLNQKYEVHIYDKTDINLKNYEHIIVTKLCNKGLSSMALGLCKDSVQEFITEALFNEKKVYVLKEGIQYREYSRNANEALYNLYNQYECKIMSYGVVLVNEASLLESIQMGVTCNDRHSKIATQTNIEGLEDTLQSHQVVEINNKRLITESDLIKLYTNGIKEVKILKKAILTPLAQDYIRLKQLKITRA